MMLVRCLTSRSRTRLSACSLIGRPGGGEFRRRRCTAFPSSWGSDAIRSIEAMRIPHAMLARMSRLVGLLSLLETKDLRAVRG
jgi:hypothetical protein